MAPNLSHDSFTERINFICYQLEHYKFLTAKDKKKLKLELKNLIEKRTKLLETLKK